MLPMSLRSALRWARLLVFALHVLAVTGAPAHALEVLGVRSTAEAREGRTLSLSRYRVPADGLLVVRVGAKAPSSRSVTFRGEEMIHAASTEVTYFTTISAEIFYLPVTAGETGTILVTYDSNGTDQRGLIAATIEGATDLGQTRLFTDGSVSQDGRTGPNLAEARLTPREDAVLMSAITVFGSGIPEAVGTEHALDAHPTTPEIVYHEVKVQGGHVAARAGSAPSLGFRNTNPRGFMDYAMVVASFTAAPEPGFASGCGIGLMGLAVAKRRRVRVDA